jgi:hypothetical protein
MINTLEAIIDEHGEVKLTEPIQLKGQRRALVTILDEPPTETWETALLSESSLAADWARPEEDAAWAHLK